MVKIKNVETATLSLKLTQLKDQLDLLMQKLMFDERKWETIMMMQVQNTFEKLLLVIKT